MPALAAVAGVVLAGVVPVARLCYRSWHLGVVAAKP